MDTSGNIPQCHFEIIMEFVKNVSLWDHISLEIQLISFLVWNSLRRYHPIETSIQEEALFLRGELLPITYGGFTSYGVPQELAKFFPL